MPRKGEKWTPEMRVQIAETRIKNKARKEAEAKGLPLPPEDKAVIPPFVPAPEPVSDGPPPPPEPTPEPVLAAPASDPPPAAPESFAPTGVQNDGMPFNRAEIREIKSEVEECDRQIAGMGEEGAFDPKFMAGVDLNMVKRRRSMLLRKIDQKMPKATTGPRQDAMVARRKVLEAEIQEGMLSVNDYFGTAQSNRDQRGLVGKGSHQLRWAQANGAAIQEWKRLGYMTDPQEALANPDFTNVETIRPGRPQRAGLGSFAAKVQSPGFTHGLSPVEERAQPLRNLDAEEVAEFLGVSVEQVYAMRGQTAAVSA